MKFNIKKKPREEAIILSELEALCKSPGYAQVIAYFCLRDNMITYVDSMKATDITERPSLDRLIRSEISILIGFLTKGDLDIEMPRRKVFKKYISKTESLLDELHRSMIRTMVKSTIIGSENSSDFTRMPASGNYLREPVFYNGETAYPFQYIDFFAQKYSEDDAWFMARKGYSLEQAQKITRAIYHSINQKSEFILRKSKGRWINEQDLLSPFSFSVEEISSISEEDILVVKSFVKSLTSPNNVKNTFSEIGDFNLSNAYPIIELRENYFVSFQIYSLVEALYETPFFWLLGDQNYKEQALQHRGNFTEGFAAEKLRLVFGNNKVFTNIVIQKGKKKVGELSTRQNVQSLL
jgi:hypothetical protein